MKDKKYNYILEKPIKTNIGYFYPIEVGNHDEFEEFGGVAGLDRVALINYFKNLVIENNQFQPFLDIVEELDMLNFIKFCGASEYDGSFLSNLHKQYVDLFKFCTKCDNNIIFYLIETDEEFQQYLNLIREMNGIRYEATNPNPEIERRNQLTRKLESMRNENIDFESMFTSACVGLKKLPHEINKVSLYAFYKLFGRVGQFKNYNTSVLFSTVSTEAKIEPWYKSDVIHKNENYITEDQLNRAVNLGELQNDL